MARATMLRMILRSGTTVTIGRCFSDATGRLIEVYILAWNRRLTLADFAEIAASAGPCQKPEELRISTDDYGAFVLTSRS